MDISDNYEQQQQQGDHQMQPQSHLHQHAHHHPQSVPQQMQCDMYPTVERNGFNPANVSADGFPSNVLMERPITGFPMQTAIPLPPPPLSRNQAGQTQPPPTSTEIDIDSLLLQQFSCLGTTDHEDLINQFQSLMNNQMNKDSAKFFLEMSNWNLQTAVGCYLDYCNFQPVPSMKIAQQYRPSELQQAWRLENDGTEIWPNGCYLMSPTQRRHIEMPALKPGDTCDIMAEVPATQPASMWRMCTPNGWYFGEKIWMLPPGTCDLPAELAEHMSQLRPPSNPTNTEYTPEINIVISTDMK